MYRLRATDSGPLHYVDDQREVLFARFKLDCDWLPRSIRGLVSLDANHGFAAIPEPDILGMTSGLPLLVARCEAQSHFISIVGLGAPLAFRHNQPGYFGNAVAIGLDHAQRF